MTTTKASPTVPMPDCQLSTVRTLFSETKMADRDFRNLTRDIRSNATKYLDNSGFVSVEKQDPAALRHFLDQVKKSNPTLAKRYPYFWPVLAYLELYLNGRYRSHFLRHRGDAPSRPSRPQFPFRAPIWIRFAHSEKTGKSLQETSEIGSDKCPRVSRPTPRRTKRRRPVEKNSYKTEPTVTEVGESITQPVDSGPGLSNRITAPISYFLGSFGSSIEAICAHFVSG